MIKILMMNPMFKGLGFEKIQDYISAIETRSNTYNKEEVAYNAHSDKREIMFVLSGGAKVEQYHEDGSVTFLKRLKPGDVFGVLSIFNDTEDYPTHVVFEKKSKVLCISEAQVLKLLQRDEKIMKNYLVFFNGQVQYLLNRIALFSMLSVEDRLLQYFTQLEDQQDGHQHKMTRIELSEYLGISRASLYRVLEKLEREERIEVKGKEIIIK